MRRSVEFPGREEALEAGLKYYGGVKEVYAPETEVGQTELRGAWVGVFLVEPNQMVLASFVERGLCRSDKSYERQIRKAKKQDAGALGSFNRIARLATSS